MGVLDDEYTITADFKRWVLDKPIQQINEKTNITITYEQHKQERKIIGFTFTIKQKAKAITDTEINTKTVDIFAKFSDIERTVIQGRIAEHITRLEAKGEMVSDFHRQNITKKAVSERWGLDILAAAQEQQQQEDKRKALEQLWQETPNGTRFRHKNGSIWIKYLNYLQDEEGRVLPEGQTINFFQHLEIISESA